MRLFASFRGTSFRKEVFLKFKMWSIAKRLVYFVCIIPSFLIKFHVWDLGVVDER